ncbi:hypothetical protein COX94_01810 [Candidatus Nomurabacteria bacterium CG_4_10_14_0_2_um_filter_33_9]|uniref:Uncharacterized protein n=1 Tax=Candidatus Nomurabacteria bacterium CG_4_10_14_0_2_um_filter_33_9 TaxID=1974728 RepID=A0A2J0MLE7_9BACT|nr:MAG: hypothetical protein COX94_01810 [Candidatus Nomurabacteria bacterium CG_4_10_14_0_2_um_filter_33_9]
MSKFEWDSHSEEAKEIKNKINQEGWESQEVDTGAAVLIGKKEEMVDLENKLENEGRTKDLATYIKLHKETLLSEEDPELGDLTKAMIKLPENLRKPGLVFPIKITPEKLLLKYLDKTNNISFCEINYHKIDEIKEAGATNTFIKNKLAELGFYGFYDSSDQVGMINWDKTEGKTKEIFRKVLKELELAETGKKKRLEEEAQEKKTKEFEF